MNDLARIECSDCYASALWTPGQTVQTDRPTDRRTGMQCIAYSLYTDCLPYNYIPGDVRTERIRATALDQTFTQ